MNSQRSPFFWITGGFLLGMLLTYHLLPTYINYTGQHYNLKRHDNEGVLKFGNPGPINDLFKRNAYTVSYNRRDRIPYWVGEHLTEESLKRGEGVSRDKSRFKGDVNLPEMFRAYPNDYTNSGYDRGHMAPAGDAVASQAGMDETFLLTNIAPQIGPGFNRQYWAYFEGFCRDLTKNFTDVYVYTGPLFLPKVGRNTYSLADTRLRSDGTSIMNAMKFNQMSYEMSYSLIGSNGPNVAVPTHFFKILLLIKDGNYFSGSFVLPNQAISRSVLLSQFQVDLKAIEKASGLQFFSELDRGVFLNLCDHIQCIL
ncbi:hypothetical protein G6F46_003345 [Rhizopus delemar]|nr:hypothetical protein G6F43_006338 [Rhizopus delemar]KAG1499612.1 hypothetical protein G6F54_004287 [Rhizopus delemar]KAG1525398.1 hypothetical protein G6F52_003361 [Rhizopus delemar]KAG1552894.1 hypothetical protein G6F49_008533 [Rhizopus delemar]KAG1588638.1 hypothetical protein G6F48_005143 [Rhizopus delemar]